jgi:hypothetical protein
MNPGLHVHVPPSMMPKLGHVDARWVRPREATGNRRLASLVKEYSPKEFEKFSGLYWYATTGIEEKIS